MLLYYSHMKIALLFNLIATLIVVNGVSFKKSDIINNDNVHMYELPRQEDLIVYLKSLESVIKYNLKRTHLIEHNLAFGLFLVSVNLKKALERKNETLPEYLKTYVSELLRQNEMLLYAFNNNDYYNSEEDDKMFNSLFNDVSFWLRRIPRFDNFLAKIKTTFLSHNQLESIYVNWNKYTRNVFEDLFTSLPNPELSDQCIAMSARNQISHSKFWTKCQVFSYECLMMVVNGTEIGYSLTHRLVPLLLLRHGRGCTVFSPRTDKKIIEDMCTTIYGEANFIANYGYQSTTIDLIFEQMALCGLEGYAQFLRRSWLKDGLNFQTHYGCFNDFYPKPVRNETILRLRNPKPRNRHTVHYGQCNRHVTSVGSAAIATAARFVMETYY